MPDLEQTLATMPLQTSLSSDNFKKFKPLLCPPVAELQRLSRNVIRCLPLSRLPSTLPVKDKNSLIRIVTEQIVRIVVTITRGI